MRVIFHGAAGEVTGSCHEVEAAGHRVLLDCGLIQGSRADEARNREDFGFDSEAIDAVVLSHAHIDHCGRLPLLVKRGFRGPIWTQRATADLLKVMLEDSAKLAQADAERARRRLHEGRGGRDDEEELEPLYTLDDVTKTLKHVRAIGYDAPTALFPGLVLTLRDAGHILGSASVELVETAADGTRRTLVFSGDLGPTGTPILRDAAPVPHADLLLLEATYGGRLHRERAATVTELGEIFDEAWRDRGNVVIPAFAVGRTQELLYAFAQHFDDWGLGRWQIFLDSPMATKVLGVYERHAELFDEEAARVFATTPHPLRLKNLHLTDSTEDSMAINRIDSGAIIIAGSGMANGGRVRHHLRHRLPFDRNHVVFVGYQAAGTLGRRLVDGAAYVRVLGSEVPVRAKRHTVGGLSAHADQAGLLDWYGRVGGRPDTVLVHGEDDAREAMARELRRRFGADVELARPDMARTVGR
ncbi:MBL fold metallo-hydrolase RNA specificity domain-containing protein [Silanimonas sp.]|jgi:metallo-beta-lactamase family protein|uniref:MBL fold metallo-hydrolase RNA specificity domain-containing protein n=1 Tax=Silanimonas sp. TaxID=1929290 RepID=UPI0037C56932